MSFGREKSNSFDVLVHSNAQICWVKYADKLMSRFYWSRRRFVKDVEFCLCGDPLPCWLSIFILESCFTRSFSFLSRLNSLKFKRLRRDSTLDGFCHLCLHRSQTNDCPDSSYVVFGQFILVICLHWVQTKNSLLQMNSSGKPLE